MLNGKPKSNEDVAAMLGMRAAELPKGAARLVAEKNYAYEVISLLTYVKI